MGQRHQIFAIAKIKGRYRSLAAVHNKWLYGATVAFTCDRLIKILQCPENRHLIDLELSRATTLPDGDFWHRVIPPPNPNPTAEALTGNTDHYDAPEFPFLTTCRVAGTSLEPGTGYVSHASNMRWNADYDGAPNDDGITVLDITDPAAVRHCFVVFHDGTAVEDGRRIRGMMPLVGKEYASLYHGAEELEQCAPVFESLDNYPIVDSGTLRETWPRGQWYARAPRSHPSHPPQTTASTADGEEPGTPNPDPIIESLIERRLEDGQYELDAKILDHLDYPSTLRDYFGRHPEAITSKPFGPTLFLESLKGSDTIDLHRYPALLAADVLDIIGRAASHLKMLDISGNPNIHLEHLCSLPATTTIDHLYIWGSSAALTYRDIRASMPAGAVRHIYSRDDFLATYQDFKEYFAAIISRGPIPNLGSPNRALPTALASHVCWVPVQIEEPVVGPQRSLFGKTSALYSKLKNIDVSKSYELDKAFPHFLVRLDDVHLTVDELLFPVTKFMSTAANVEPIMFQYATSSKQLVHALAFSMAFRNPEAISSLPPKAHIKSREIQNSLVSGNFPNYELPFAQNRWTVLVVQERCKDVTVRFRVAFITADAEGGMRFCDVQEFIKEAASGGDGGSDGVGGACTRIWQELTRDLEEIGEDGVAVLSCERETVKALWKLMAMIKARGAR